MKRNIYLVLLGVLALSFGLTSCEKIDSLDDYKSVDIGGTATAKISGEYFVTLDAYIGGAWVIDPVGMGYKKIMIYNTATNRADSVWIDDLNIWPTKARISCNVTTGQFTPCTADNIKDAGETIAITDGKVITDGCHTSAGNLTDSIVIEFQWSDLTTAATAGAIPTGSPTRFAGYKRTGFLEDEH